MALTVIWSPEAERTFDEIIDFLEKRWTDREIRKFISDTNKTIEVVKAYPNLFKESKKLKSVHRANINRHNSFTYRFSSNKKIIEIISFWFDKSDPAKIKF